MVATGRPASKAPKPILLDPQVGVQHSFSWRGGMKWASRAQGGARISQARGQHLAGIHRDELAISSPPRASDANSFFVHPSKVRGRPSRGREAGASALGQIRRAPVERHAAETPVRERAEPREPGVRGPRSPGTGIGRNWMASMPSEGSPSDASPRRTLSRHRPTSRR